MGGTGAAAIIRAGWRAGVGAVLVMPLVLVDAPVGDPGSSGDSR